MKLLVPVAITLVGLGAGVGAGFMLKPPPPPPEEHAGNPCAEAAPAADDHGTEADGHDDAEAVHAMEDCEEVAGVDPFAPADHGAAEAGGDEEHAPIYVPFEKPFVVPVFAGEKVVSMVVISLSVAAYVENPDIIRNMEPRLRDRILDALFLHSNSGGFNGSFTTGRKIEDLKTALARAARQVMGAELVNEVLITEINRQDV